MWNNTNKILMIFLTRTQDCSGAELYGQRELSPAPAGAEFQKIGCYAPARGLNFSTMKSTKTRTFGDRCRVCG